MVKALHATLIIIAVILALLLVIILRRCFRPKTHKNTQTLHHGIARLHQVSPQLHSKFTWADNPSLATDAVENGWPRFAFAAGKNEKTNLEMGWEVCEGSADLTQKIRWINPEGRTTIVRAGLPLPGPNSSFPQEAYFEITIVERDEGKKISEGDKVKLLNGPETVDKMGTNDGVLISVGLTLGGPLGLWKPGSICFNSTASLYLDGAKLAFESENEKWGIPNKVIGCGYNPSQKKVFFTVDAQLVHEIPCKTDDYSSPLYPTLAANTDVTILVNLGQSPFKYSPANLQRTPNPCFINGTSLGYEDSRELFSMGRIDSQWLQRSANNNTVSSIKAMGYDQDSDGDLFEIVLDNTTGKSPYATIHHQ
ncbi:SPla/RYanodine receptor (SPRY) domain-containing protein [Striga asiatica]|uniref:SPla/RYanodine receptor (SPRY) domain-containing protein n=1 Tax=Striga asiatica TaxID=4170 RepID=A0A5A7PPT3_STRAF|nr:SPla/RYanodine receptor (SPRY) domain-containing protein [Striga asiatica]